MSAKTEREGDLVLLVACGSTFEASVIRSALEAHGLFCFVQGENHRALLQGLGAYIDLRVLVRRADLEEARALLADLRERPAGDEEPPEEDTPPPQRLEPAPMELRAATARAFLPGLGGAHIYAGATVRGVGLGLAQLGGVALMLLGHLGAGAGLIALAIGADAVGARAVVRERAQRGRLPRARARE